MKSKVLVINTNFNGVLSDTELLLQPFILGMKAEGARVELIDTRDLTIIPCRACTQEPDFISKGECNCNDDMQMLYPKFRESDIWVFSSSMQSQKLPSAFINILDRLEPLFQPVSLQKKSNSGKIVFFSASEECNSSCFKEAETAIKDFSMLFSRQYAGSLLRHHSWALASMKKLGLNVDDIYNAAYKAGLELIKNGSITQETSSTFSRQIIPSDIIFSK